MGEVTPSFTYDAVGNIQKIFRVNADNSQTTLHLYTYDNYNQLTRDMDGENGVVVDYTYDDSGNITEKDRGRFYVLTQCPQRKTGDGSMS